MLLVVFHTLSEHAKGFFEINQVDGQLPLLFNALLNDVMQYKHLLYTLPLPLRKPACSFLSVLSTVSTICRITILARILLGTESSAATPVVTVIECSLLGYLNSVGLFLWHLLPFPYCCKER